VTWTIWLIVDSLALVAMRKEGALNAQITGAVVGTFAVTTLTLFFGTLSFGFIELVSIAGALLGIVLWQATGSAILAIVCSQATVLIGAIPTIVTAYHNPESESPLAWSIWLLSCVFALLAVPKWNLAHALQPITFTVLEGTMVYLVVIKPYWL